MINHLHAIISHHHYEQIPNIMRDFKRHTATEIKNYLSGLGDFSKYSSARNYILGDDSLLVIDRVVSD